MANDGVAVIVVVVMAVAVSAAETASAVPASSVQAFMIFAMWRARARVFTSLCLYTVHAGKRTLYKCLVDVRVFKKLFPAAVTRCNLYYE